jgi:hypothetical protein
MNGQLDWKQSCSKIQLRQAQAENGADEKKRIVRIVRCVPVHSKHEGNNPESCKEPGDKQWRSQGTMERARPVRSAFFPLDEELGLLSGSLTPTQQEHLVHLAIWMPFAQAGKMLESLLGVQISEATVRRLTERAGAAYEAVQTSEAEQSEPEGKASPVPEKQAMSSDGAYVPLVNGQWAEVRTAGIGDVPIQTTTSGAEQMKVTNLSYFSRMTDAETFERLVEGEIRRRGVRDALAVCAVTDGAAWLQSFIDLHRPDAVRILDFPHAAEYVTAIGEAVKNSGRHLPKKWLEGVLHRLKHDGPDRVLLHLSRLCQRCLDPEMDKKLRYLSTRRDLMQYPAYQQAGWPIGSGMIESANKVVMQARLKGSGMRWASSHVNPMLALRTAVCNQRWPQACQAIQKERLRQIHLQRQNKSNTHLTLLVASTLFLLLRFRPPVPALVPVSSTPLKAAPSSSPPATLPGSSRPSASHPWKRGPACRPKTFAKI